MLAPIVMMPVRQLQPSVQPELLEKLVLHVKVDDGGVQVTVIVLGSRGSLAALTLHDTDGPPCREQVTLASRVMGTDVQLQPFVQPVLPEKLVLHVKDDDVGVQVTVIVLGSRGSLAAVTLHDTDEGPGGGGGGGGGAGALLAGGGAGALLAGGGAGALLAGGGVNPFPLASHSGCLLPMATTALKKPHVAAMLDAPGFGRLEAGAPGALEAGAPGALEAGSPGALEAGPPGALEAQLFVDGPPTTMATAHGALLGTQLVVIVIAPGLPAISHTPDVVFI